jgi:hypothetical protein
MISDMPSWMKIKYLLLSTALFFRNYALRKWEKSIARCLLLARRAQGEMGITMARNWCNNNAKYGNGLCFDNADVE